MTEVSTTLSSSMLPIHGLLVYTGTSSGNGAMCPRLTTFSISPSSYLTEYDSAYPFLGFGAKGGGLDTCEMQGVRDMYFEV